MQERINNLNQWGGQASLGAVINREIQAFNLLEGELKKDNFEGAYKILTDLKQDIMEAKAQEDMAIEAMTQLNIEAETDELEPEEYSWTTFIGAMSAIGLAASATYYKLMNRKSEEKVLFNNVVKEQKSKTSAEKLLV